MEALKETLLRSDFDQVRQHPKYQSSNVRMKDGSIFKWTLNIPGGRGTSWEGLVYDIDVTFSRRHPFEPPRVEFPRTPRNVKNPGHPLIDGAGRLRMQKLSFDKWLPTIEANTVIGWLFHLFETEPPCVTSGNGCPFTHLSSETVLQVHTFLDAVDLGRLSQTSKHMLSLCFDEATWAKLYYRSCTSLDGLLGEKEGGACPVRVMSASGKWFWEGAREAYIRSWEMRTACSHEAFATAKTQELHAMWELGGLLTVTSGLLLDIHGHRISDPFHLATSAQRRHMERVLESQTMRIASLQRLLAWPGVCRGLLSENEEDSCLQIGLWDQPDHRPFSSGRSSARTPTCDGVDGGDLSGREARLSAGQREALRQLFGNLAAQPAATTLRRRCFFRGAGEAGGAAGAGAGAGVETQLQSAAAVLPRTPSECIPHHHHAVAGPRIPYGMGMVELPFRDGGTPLVHPVLSANGTGTPMHVGAGTAAVGGATLDNVQPACSMGGLYWPTLYDLTMAKRRQRERLHDCFRKFTRGQKLDVRDPSGVWLGAEVLWAPGDGGPNIDGWGADGGAASGAGAGIGAPPEGAGGGGGQGAGSLPGYSRNEGSIPEWRRLLQHGLLADGGHLTLLPNNAHAAAAAAAAATAAATATAAVTAAANAAAAANSYAGANGRGFDPNSPVSLRNSGEDWVTMEAVSASQSLLASAVASAADSRPWPPLPPAATAPRVSRPPTPLSYWTNWASTPSAAPPLPAGNGGAAVLTFTQGTAPPRNGRKLVQVHYEGHKSKYDEWISVQSPRLAPFRSRTTRPLSVTMQSVEKVVNGASVSSSRGVPAPDCVEISMSCPWISHCAGGGVVTYRLPRSTTLGAVLADFCHLAGISLWRATIQRARLYLASDMRNGRCDVEELDDRRTLEYLDITSGSVLLVCVAPAVKDLSSSRRPCVPPPLGYYPGRRPGGRRGPRGRRGPGEPGSGGGGGGGSGPEVIDLAIDDIDKEAPIVASPPSSGGGASGGASGVREGPRLDGAEEDGGKEGEQEEEQEMEEEGGDEAAEEEGDGTGGLLHAFAAEAADVEAMKRAMGEGGGGASEAAEEEDDGTGALLHAFATDAAVVEALVSAVGGAGGGTSEAGAVRGS